MSDPTTPPGPENLDRAPQAPSHARAFVVRAAATYGASAATAFLSLANVLLISRALGPEGRGGVAFLMTVAYLSAQVASLGIQQSLSNIGASEPRERPSLATNAIVFSIALGAAAIVVLVVLMELVPAAAAGSSTLGRTIALASIPLIILGDYHASLLAANYRFGITNAAVLLTPCVILAVNGALALDGALTVTRAVASWVAGQIAAALLVLTFVIREDGLGRFERALARRMTVFGLKTHGGRVLNFGNYRLDQWLVGSIAGDRQLGLYSVAVAWSEGLFLLPNAIASVQRPDIVRADPETARRRALRAHAIVQVVTVVLVVTLLVLARPLCVGVFGDEFAGSVDQLRILALGGFGIVTLKQLGDALIAQRRPLLESAAVAIAFVCTLVLDVILIPGHGGLGAAISSSTAYTVGGLAAALLFTRTIGARRPHDAPYRSAGG
jgi:O-antigen/teichoic acid export membrane protein